MPPSAHSSSPLLSFASLGRSFASGRPLIPWRSSSTSLHGHQLKRNSPSRGLLETATGRAGRHCHPWPAQINAPQRPATRYSPAGCQVARSTPPPPRTHLPKEGSLLLAGQWSVGLQIGAQSAPISGLVGAHVPLCAALGKWCAMCALRVGRALDAHSTRVQSV